MPTISRTTNPTGLKQLDAQHFSVRTHTDANGARSFWLERFDFAASKLPPGLCIACIAHAGNTEEFFRLGTVENPDHAIRPLHELATDRPLRFRFLIHEIDDPKLIAFADNIKAADESGLLGNSLVDIEPADLHGPVWKLEIPDTVPGADKPVLLVERQLFPTAKAASRDLWIAVLVMPEVMRQIGRVIAENYPSLDDPEIWIYGWADFLTTLGVSDLPEDADRIAREGWVEEIVSAFCAKATVKSQISRAEAELSGGA